MTTMEDAGFAFLGAALLAVLGYLLRYRGWTGLVKAFASSTKSGDDLEEAANAAGKGALLMAVPLAVYGVVLLAGYASAEVALVTYAIVGLVFYRALHWVLRAGAAPDETF